MSEQTLQYRSTSGSVTLYWEKPEDALPGSLYTVLLDGAFAGETDRTHFTLEGLEPAASHTVKVRRGDTVIGTVPVRTETARRRLNVRDHGAAGDGKTMDTAAVQAAIDQCGAGEEVWFPAGVYRTGALRLHSDMALCLDEGAVLQGTDRPEDYLPRIPSRFEGIE